jgi:predicted metalloprotease with PDZ domain
MNPKSILSFALLLFLLISNLSCKQDESMTLQYEVSFTDAASQYCQVEFHIQHWKQDTIYLKMPKWMPGYYQLMHYARAVEHVTASDTNGNKIETEKVNENTWRLIGVQNKSFTVQYALQAD